MPINEIGLGKRLVINFYKKGLELLKALKVPTSEGRKIRELFLRIKLGSLGFNKERIRVEMELYEIRTPA